MSNHAWCRDVARDEAVRAAEDGRDRPMPTLGEAIARPFADAASGGGEGEMSRAGQIESADGTNTPKCTERDNLAASGGGEQPRGWLTSEEKAAIRWAMSEGFDEEVLCGLLSRSSPPEVVLESWREAAGEVVSLDDVRAALAAIGVAVKEVT
jgi:hypothetical protein